MTNIITQSGDVSRAAISAVTENANEPRTEVHKPAACLGSYIGVSDPLLSTKVVCASIGLSRWAIRRRIAEGTFPKPIAVAKNKNVFRASAINAWISSQETEGSRDKNDDA